MHSRMLITTALMMSTAWAQEKVCDLYDARRLILTGELLISQQLTALGAADCDHEYVSEHYRWPTAVSLLPSPDVPPDQLQQLRNAAIEADRLRRAGKTVAASASFAGRLRVEPTKDLPAVLIFDSMENLKIEPLPDAAELPVIPICDLFQNLSAWKGKRIAVRGEIVDTMEGSWISGRCQGAFVTNGYRWPVSLSYGGPAYYSESTAALLPKNPPSSPPKGEQAMRGRQNVVRTATYIGQLRMRAEYQAFCRPGGDYITNGFGHLNAAAAELMVESVRDIEVQPRSPVAMEDDDSTPCLPANQKALCDKATSLGNAASLGCLEKVRELLATKGIDSQDGKESPALSAAIQRGSEAMVEMLLEKGAPINPVTVRMWSPLGEAAWRHQVRIMKMLLAKGADPEAKDSHGISYLPTYGLFDERLVRTLLEAGANVNARDNKGRTALMNAAGYGYENTVKLLIAHRADVNLSDNLGRTALMHAAAGKYVDAIPHLLDNHADLYAKDHAGDTAFEIAKKSKNEVAAELLAAATANKK